MITKVTPNEMGYSSADGNVHYVEFQKGGAVTVQNLPEGSNVTTDKALYTNTDTSSQGDADLKAFVRADITQRIEPDVHGNSIYQAPCTYVVRNSGVQVSDEVIAKKASANQGSIYVKNELFVTDEISVEGTWYLIHFVEEYLTQNP